MVRAQAAGVIREVRVRQGEEVHAGEVLATLANPEIEENVRIVRARLEYTHQALLRALATQDTSAAQMDTEESARLSLKLAEAERKQSELALRCPISGIVTTPEIEERTGEYLGEGQDFATVANRTFMRARILVRDLNLSEVRTGAGVELHVSAYPLRFFSGKVAQIMPATSLDRPLGALKEEKVAGQQTTNYIAVIVDIPNPDGALKEGMTGTAKIFGPRKYPLAWQAGRAVWRWARMEVW